MAPQAMIAWNSTEQRPDARCIAPLVHRLRACRRRLSAAARWSGVLALAFLSLLRSSRSAVRSCQCRRSARSERAICCCCCCCCTAVAAVPCRHRRRSQLAVHRRTTWRADAAAVNIVITRVRHLPSNSRSPRLLLLMTSFSALYTDAQLCVLRFLPLSDLALMVRVCRSIATVVAQVQPPVVLLKSRANGACPSGTAPPVLPHPQSVFCRFVTLLDLSRCSPQLLSVCAPFSLRERCPRLSWLQLHFHSVEAGKCEAALSLLPVLPLFWPSNLLTLILQWDDVHSLGQNSTPSEMADQLRALCRVAGSIPTLVALSLVAHGDLALENVSGASLSPLLSPLLPLTHLVRLKLSITCRGWDTRSRWISDEDCSVICQLPSLTDLSVNRGMWSREGLLEHLTHSDEATAFRARIVKIEVAEFALDEETRQTCRELLLACPKIAATFN